jgi:hypothetical protein
MSDLGKDVLGQLAKNAAERNAALGNSQPVPSVSNTNGITGDTLASTVAAVQPTQPVSSQNTDNKTVQTPAVQQPAAKQEPPKEPVAQKVEPEKPAEIKNPDETNRTEKPEDIVQWDDDVPDAPNSTPQSDEKIDYKKLGSALQLEINSEADLVKTVKERFEKLSTLEKTSNLEGVPDILKQTLEVAKKGGDWVQYAGVSAVDFSKFEPIDLFERDYERLNSYRFKNPDGTIDIDKLDLELDSIADGVKAMHGEQIKAKLVAEQNYRKNQIIAEATAQQEKFQKSLAEATTGLSKALPSESFGIVIEPKHSSHLYEGITKGTLIKKHLGDIDPSILSKLDASKLAKTLAIAEWGEKISQFRYKQGEVAGKKALLQSSQNVQITPVSSPPAPEVKVDTPPPTSTELLMRQQQNIKPKNSL